jgi:AraC family cel operon transcriptional repressor
MRGRHPCDLHDHDFAEIFWLESGSGVHVVNGTRQNLEAGDLILIRPADAHEYFSASGGSGLGGAAEPYTLVNLAFPWSTVEFLKERYFADDPAFFGGNASLPAQFKLTPAQIRHWHAAVVEMSASPRKPILIERFLLNLFHELAGFRPLPGARTAALVLAPTGDSTDSESGPGLAATEACPDWLKRACEQIRDPLQFRGGTQQFAQLAGRSPEHVAREVRRCFGITPTEIVNRARLNHAAGELALSSQGILEIALSCGFSSLAHFYLLFQKQYHQSPRQYRLRSQRVVS